jgi:diphthamide synthase (EF-2-diphthine--ammonia ligase)
VTCVDPAKLDCSYAGRDFDAEFLDSLPDRVDPCGENGEFHSFVFDGPNLVNRVEFDIGERVLRDNRFCFCDLVPKTV